MSAARPQRQGGTMSAVRETPIAAAVPARNGQRQRALAGSDRMVRLWRRANSTGITIRAVRPDDRERIVKAFRALEAESIRQRFFFLKKELSGEELRRLTESDGVRDVVLVATVTGGNQEMIVGVGRYARNAATAEIAFTVEEDYQGRGIASELLRQLTDIAGRSGVVRFEADVLADNAPMLKVFQRSGLPMKQTRAGGIVHLTLFLDDGPGSG
jgi:RimJ/RimL family protein N-acetyltransferase